MGRLGRLTSHAALAALEGLLIASLLVVLISGTAFAAKGGSGGKGGGGSTGGSGTLALVLLDSTDGLPHFKGLVTYTMSTTATLYPYVSTACTQNGKTVLSTSAGYFPSYPWPSAQTFTLGPTGYWTSGAADCTAKLYSMDSGSQVVLTTITYHVYA
jgi:hypothetical protein